MKFLCMVRSAEHAGPPPADLMAAIAKLGEEAGRAGVLAGMGGLAATAMSAKVRLQGGELRVTDGPFTEAKEVIGGFAIYDLPSMKEAKEWTLKFMEVHRLHWPGWEGETEIRPMY